MAPGPAGSASGGPHSTSCVMVVRASADRTGSRAAAGYVDHVIEKRSLAMKLHAPACISVKNCPM